MNEQRLASYRHQLVSANLAEFGDTADRLNWISPAGAMAAQTERGKRLQAIGQRLHLAFKGTKPHIGPLSPGCRICGEGGLVLPVRQRQMQLPLFLLPEFPG